MEIRKIWESQSGKLKAEVVEKNTGLNQWKEFEIFRVYKNKEGEWRRAHGFGARDIRDVMDLIKEAEALLGDTSLRTSEMAAPQAPEPASKVPLFEDDLPF